MTGTGEIRADGKKTGSSAGPGGTVRSGGVAGNLIVCGHTAGWLVAGRLTTCLREVVRRPRSVLAGQAESITAAHTSRVESSGGGHRKIAVTPKRGETTISRRANVGWHGKSEVRVSDEQ